MKTIYWECPTCHGAIETSGRDESARISIKDFKAQHVHTERVAAVS